MMCNFDGMYSTSVNSSPNATMRQETISPIEALLDDSPTFWTPLNVTKCTTRLNRKKPGQTPRSRTNSQSPSPRPPLGPTEAPEPSTSAHDDEGTGGEDICSPRPTSSLFEATRRDVSGTPGAWSSGTEEFEEEDESSEASSGSAMFASPVAPELLIAPVDKCIMAASPSNVELVSSGVNTVVSFAAQREEEEDAVLVADTWRRCDPNSGVVFGPQVRHQACAGRYNRSQSRDRSAERQFPDVERTNREYKLVTTKSIDFGVILVNCKKSFTMISYQCSRARRWIRQYLQRNLSGDVRRRCHTVGKALLIWLAFSAVFSFVRSQ